MSEIKLLIAEDDKEIRDLLKKYLERELYAVDTATDGNEALYRFRQGGYHLVILDLMMPQLDGIEVCKAIRSISNVPIVMLTAKDHETEKILGLSIGADDYITKPFSIHEVLARVKSLLRRYMILGSEGEEPSQHLLVFKGIAINPKAYTVHIEGSQTALTAKEFELLKLLASNPGQVFTKTQIFRQVWGTDYIEDDNTVMVHIRKLRKKIELDPSQPQYIQTVWGIGYKFSGEKA
ncbi:response regulator transcription factor [Paenibacillus lupini]|uniref:response regulator transcription factor n=1 Tax=Paenibacillus lupini TaxID=1450204 RepID=UPI0014224980|nr:response regulator transcription factor [Paenibacillus lupini]NIK21545.1 DNA-binding response OmpR family regulator [Paenibacillus lupini]